MGFFDKINNESFSVYQRDPNWLKKVETVNNLSWIVSKN